VETAAVLNLSGLSEIFEIDVRNQKDTLLIGSTHICVTTITPRFGENMKKILSLSVFVIALSGIAHAGAGCCPVSAAKPAEKADGAVVKNAKIEAPATTQVVAKADAVVKVAATEPAACSTVKKCDTKSECSAEAKAECGAGKEASCAAGAASAATAKACGEACSCKG
jgi:hypothetical protein